MSSPHAIRMEERGRVLLWRRHAEPVVIADGGAARTVQGIWKRVRPEGARTDGAGAAAYDGEAMVVVRATDIDPKPSSRALVNRNGEDWSIVHYERQDEWTWVLHLARPNADLRMPARFRR